MQNVMRNENIMVKREFKKVESPVLRNLKKKQAKRRAMVRRRFITITVTTGILLSSVVGIYNSNPVQRFINPTKVLNNCAVVEKSVDTSATYLDNFVSSLEGSDKYDLRELRSFIMQLNGMKSVEDYHNYSTLKVPVIK
jgi:hypothetical protein